MTPSFAMFLTKQRERARHKADVVIRRYQRRIAEVADKTATDDLCDMDVFEQRGVRQLSRRDAEVLSRTYPGVCRVTGMSSKQ